MEYGQIKNVIIYFIHDKKTHFAIKLKKMHSINEYCKLIFQLSPM